MAGAGDIKAGSAYIELSTKDSLSSGLNAAAGKLKSFGYGVAAVGASIAGIGASITTPFILGARMFAKFGDDMSDLSLRTGIAVDVLSELDYAAKITGVEMGLVEIVVRKMQKTLADASDGGVQAAQALGLIGLEAKDLAGLSPDQQFQRIADAIASIEDPARKTQAAVGLFGRSGTAMLPLIDGMKSLRKEARETGFVMSAKAAQGANLLDESMRRLDATTGKVFLALGAAVAPSLTKLYNNISKVLVVIRRWIDENQDLVAMIFHWGQVMAVAGTALVVLGTAIVGLGFVLGGLGTLVATVVGALGLVASVVTAIVSPIGIAIVTIASLGAAFLYTSKTARGVASDIGAAFSGIAKDAQASFGLVKVAIAGGDVKSAIKVLWSFIKTEFEVGWANLKIAAIAGVNAIAGYWEAVKTSAARIWVDLQAGFETTWEAIKTTASNAAQGLLLVFATVAGKISDVFWNVFEFIFGNQLQVLVKGLDLVGKQLIVLGRLTGKLSKQEADALQGGLQTLEKSLDDFGPKQRKKAEEFYQGAAQGASDKIKKNNEELETKAAKIEDDRIEKQKKLQKVGTLAPMFQDEAIKAQEDATEAQADNQKAIEEAKKEAARRELEAAIKLNNERNAPVEYAKEASDAISSAFEGMAVLGQFGGRGIVAELGGDSSGKKTADNTSKMIDEQKKTNKLLIDAEPSGEFI